MPATVYTDAFHAARWPVTPEGHGAAGDGARDDTASVQAAMDAAASGGVVQLSPGKTYRCTTDVLPPTGSTVTGGGTIDLVHDGTSQSTAVRLEDVTDVTISGITITQSNATERDANYGLIRGDNADRVIVRDCRLGTHASTLIWTGECSHWLVSGNYGSGCWADGFHFSRNTTHVTVTGNEFYNVRDDAIAVNSILADGAVTYDPCTDFAIIGNVISDTLIAGNGIAVNGGNRITIIGNTVTAPIANGIYVGAVFTGTQETHPWLDVTVSGNVIHNVPAGNNGITVTGESGTPGVRLACQGNIVDTQSDATGIYSDYVDHGTYTGNVVTTSGAAHGLHILHNNRSTVTGNSVKGPGSATTSAGVLLNGCGYCTVTGNIATGCQVGVYEVNGANPVVVSGNVLQGNTSSAVGGTPLVTSVYRGNTSYNPRGVVSVAVPSSGVAVAAVNYDRVFYVTGNASGSATVTVGGAAVVVPAAGCVAVQVPAGVTLTPTYSSAPTWIVYGA